MSQPDEDLTPEPPPEPYDPVGDAIRAMTTDKIRRLVASYAGLPGSHLTAAADGSAVRGGPAN